ncbi:Piso0_003860 [Millerozyma farinosa CBS 7064]|uniref:dihydroorotase n=1 Tax=Pichia sorbitophila (strain ATCC MYA-4447 / BCRC 22081 / CBS 7064 / NBRC 10061 / NRRL Y-12695) TaxID=559304 RepID=G8Y6T8_PICSO|nr:Piso0_003860 [Millerozyma farinosa CBS 7064]CCE84318.1 Piso0_003860 [Millerozyma farinosa CBS 7064]
MFRNRSFLTAIRRYSTRRMTQEIDLGITADMHVHLRDGKMMELVTPTVREGGISIAYIMPNLVPPITKLDKVIEYKQDLEKLAPKTTFLMTFYLSEELTPELIREAALKKAIHGVKCYPAGVTTNSSAGVNPNDFSKFYPVFKAMEENNIVLNLHGEKPSVKGDHEDIHVMNAEPKFLPALEKLHKDFPGLKIVLEHCTTKEAVDLVEKINSERKEGEEVKVAATITAHHLFLTVDSWAGNPINFCKPVAKFPADRRSLVAAATSGKPYFFFGSDSAPHPVHNKARHTGVCAGVYTQSHAIPYLAQVFESQNKLENLHSFVNSGKTFYGIRDEDAKSSDRCVLVKKQSVVPEYITAEGCDQVVPFRAGESLDWSIEWK